ncbi:MAG TPA: FAD binding domain-containing protein [Vicinamibacterales bacterium]
MKAVTNALPKDLKGAIAAAVQARANGQSTAFAGGGSDILGQMKDRVVSPDVLVYLKSVKGLDAVTSDAKQTTIGGLITLDALAHHETIRTKYAVLAMAAETVATPQIRNVATLAGNVCQRPWCWYYRNGFPCLKNGGNRCFSIDGENQFHAIFGGGPSYIVHPSDTAPALVALDATFKISGSAGERTIPASEFFVLPKDDAKRENVLKDDEVLSAVVLPNASATMKSTYYKVMDREAWTHAIVSAAVVMSIDGQVCRDARVVLGGVAPIPWRVPDVEKMLKGQRITSELAAKAGAAAVQGARPLGKNAYKVPMTEAMVARTIQSLVGANG